MKNLIQSIHSKIQLSPTLKQAIESKFVRKDFSKSHTLLQEHQYCRQLYFLEKGVVRTYYFHNEKDVSSWFYHEGQFFTSWYSFFSQQPSFENIETLEDTIIYSIDYFTYQKLLEEFPKLERFGRLLAEEQTSGIDLFSKGYMFMSAREKYDLLLQMFPDVTLRVNLGHIASFLGITQETLSRIRKKK